MRVKGLHHSVICGIMYRLSDNPMQARKNNDIEGRRLNSGSTSVSKPIFLREPGYKEGRVSNNHIICHIFCKILS